MKYIKAYTDGACKGNPGKGGWGILVMKTDKVCVGYYGGEDNTTNNRMELMAVIKFLELIQGNDSYLVDIVSDSKYVIDSTKSWVFGWSKRNWVNSKKEPVKHTDLWQKYLELIKGHFVKFHWVKGHSGNMYNDLADRLANAGVKSPIDNKRVDFENNEDWYLRKVKIL